MTPLIKSQLLQSSLSCHAAGLQASESRFFQLEQSLRVRLKPQRACSAGRIESELQPPCGFVAVVMQFAVMSSAQWDGELVADFAAEGSILCKAQMVGIARLPSADETRLRGDEFEV